MIKRIIKSLSLLFKSREYIEGYEVGLRDGGHSDSPYGYSFTQMNDWENGLYRGLAEYRSNKGTLENATPPSK